MLQLPGRDRKTLDVEDGIELDKQVGDDILVLCLFPSCQVELFEGEPSKQFEDDVIYITAKRKLPPDGGPPREARRRRRGSHRYKTTTPPDVPILPWERLLHQISPSTEHSCSRLGDPE